MINPPLPWIGGKRKHLEQILAFLPESCNNLYAPFCGAGALELQLLPRVRGVSHLSDLNSRLIRFWSQLHTDPVQAFAQCLEIDSAWENLVELHIAAGYSLAKSRQICWKVFRKDIDTWGAGALYWYVQKAFSRMYRENSKGEFNEALAQEDRWCLPAMQEWEDLAHYLQSFSVQFEHRGWREALATVSAGDLVFLDPPYYSSPHRYVATGWTQLDTVALLRTAQELANIGARVALTEFSNIFKILPRRLSYDCVVLPRLTLPSGVAMETPDEVLLLWGFE